MQWLRSPGFFLLLVNIPLMGSTLSAQAPPEDPGVIPALLAIRGMRAGLGLEIPPDRVLRQSGGPILRDHQAAQLLAGTGPVRCSAAYTGNVMAVDCQPLDAREQEQERRLFELTNGWLGKLAREALAGASEQRVLVIGGGEPMVARVEQVDTAARRYSIDIDGFSVSGRPPRDEECSLGVAWVLQFGGRPPH